MSKFVLDSNVALKWVLVEPDSGKALRVRREFQQQLHELLSPDVFPIKVAHTLTRAKRQRRIAVSQAIVHLLDQMRTQL